MGIRAREAYYGCDDEGWTSKPIEFMNEMLFAEYEIMKLYKEQFDIDPENDNTYNHFSQDEQVEIYAKNYLFWWKLYDEEIATREPDIMKQPFSATVSVYCSKKR